MRSQAREVRGHALSEKFWKKNGAIWCILEHFSVVVSFHNVAVFRSLNPIIFVSRFMSFVRKNKCFQNDFFLYDYVVFFFFVVVFFDRRPATPRPVACRNSAT